MPNPLIRDVLLSFNAACKATNLSTPASPLTPLHFNPSFSPGDDSTFLSRIWPDGQPLAKDFFLNAISLIETSWRAETGPLWSQCGNTYNHIAFLTDGQASRILPGNLPHLRFCVFLRLRRNTLCPRFILSCLRELRQMPILRVPKDTVNSLLLLLRKHGRP